MNSIESNSNLRLPGSYSVRIYVITTACKKFLILILALLGEVSSFYLFFAVFRGWSSHYNFIYDGNGIDTLCKKIANFYVKITRWNKWKHRNGGTREETATFKFLCFSGIRQGIWLHV